MLISSTRQSAKGAAGSIIITAADRAFESKRQFELPGIQFEPGDDRLRDIGGSAIADLFIVR